MAFYFLWKQIEKFSPLVYNLIMDENENKIKQIEVGKFYFIHDGSKTGHPGFVVWKDDEANRYLVIRTDSDKPGSIIKEQKGEKHITKLKHPTEDKVINLTGQSGSGKSTYANSHFNSNEYLLVNKKRIQY